MRTEWGTETTMDDIEQPDQNDRPKRRYPAHPPPIQRHDNPVIVLVTACILERKPVLSEADVHQALVVSWQNATAWVAGSSAEHYLRKLDYVRQNPVRAGLAATAEEWLYQGTVHPLHWINGG